MRFARSPRSRSNIDGIGAFDLVSRNAMLQGLMGMETGDRFLPLVRKGEEQASDAHAVQSRAACFFHCHLGKVGR